MLLISISLWWWIEKDDTSHSLSVVECLNPHVYCSRSSAGQKQLYCSVIQMLYNISIWASMQYAETVAAAVFFFTFLLDNLVGICSKNIRSYMQNCTWDMFVYANAGDATAVSQEKAAGTFQFQSEYSSNLNQMTVEAFVSFCLFVFCCCVELPCQVFYYWLWK